MTSKDDDSRNYSCYSVRRLNPFLGVVQIVETGDSRAISPDGVDWEIQILAERPQDTWGAPARVKQQRQFLRFGVWSRVEGLSRVPANPLLDLTTMFREANRLIDILLAESARIPFPSSDRFELWLLDDEDLMPLALLASTTRIDTTAAFAVRRWVCTDNDVPSVHAGQGGKSQFASVNPTPNKSYLESVVNQRNCRGIRLWFRRTADGAGEPLPAAIALDSVLNSGQLSAESFPPLLLKSSWDDALAGAVISDYHDWLSPYLLTLQNLSDEQRAGLERKAVERAVAVEACWRLYPKIIDRGIIDAARVEARLRLSQKSVKEN